MTLVELRWSPITRPFLGFTKGYRLFFKKLGTYGGFRFHFLKNEES
jgi:hypothetical protein